MKTGSTGTKFSCITLLAIVTCLWLSCHTEKVTNLTNFNHTSYMDEDCVETCEDNYQVAADTLLAQYQNEEITEEQYNQGMQALQDTLNICINSCISVTLRGLVIDGSTGQGIAGASVQVIGDTTVTTDNDGFYEVMDIDSGNYDVVASKTGYSSSFSTATVKYRSATVYAIYLKPLSQSVTIGTSGGTVSATDPDSNEISLNIPAGALTENTEITVTPLIGLEMPALPPENHISIATVHLGPEDLTLEDSVTLTIQLPLKLPCGDTIPFFSYNDQTIEWQGTGICGTVGEDSITLTAKIMDLKIYSVMPEIQISSTTDSTDTNVSEAYLSCEDTFLIDTFQNDFTINDSESLSSTFCKSLFEQSCGVSFSHSTIYCETNYCYSDEVMALLLVKIQNDIAHLGKTMKKCLCRVRALIVEYCTIIYYADGIEYEARIVRAAHWEYIYVECECHDQGGGE